MSDKKKSVIIIKKVSKGHGGHHGGSWKVAYADFVTAMMAFFLVMWILGMDDQTKQAIEGYFSNPVGYKMGYSAGSTPLRIKVADPDASVLFGKLYAITHLRSDRWYKVVRVLRYGRLEDEAPFSSVRRLVEHEDYMLRLLRDAGLPTPAPHGFVELTPEREYLIVMEFVAGSQELGVAPVGQREIDSGLRVVRKLWEAGVAHRDIKPSNLLVRDGQVLLIDVAFATVRPTPWRQAVDLANMMLTLALRSTADEVYGRALRQFAADDIAEAFSASRSVTLPTQLRSRLRDDPRDLIAEFRRLAPPREPVAIQLWSVRRVALTVGVPLALAVGICVTAFFPFLRNLFARQSSFILPAAAVAAGAQVTLVAGPVALPTPAGLQRIDVRSAAQMHAAVMAALVLAGSSSSTRRGASAPSSRAGARTRSTARRSPTAPARSRWAPR